MVRKLEKIEKEMGYCDIKLEKERRLRQQAKFLYAESEALERFVKRFESAVGGFQHLQYDKIAQQIALEKARNDRTGPLFLRCREDFVAAGIVEMVRDEMEMLQREREGVDSKLGAFQGFGQKRNILEEERNSALEGLAPTHSTKMRKLTEEFKRVEQQWNALTEDALNFDEGLFYLARNVDYIKSSRSFLISAKGSFDIESWVESGYSSDLFRHSNIGRAKEMMEGANRNLKLAQKELFCVGSMSILLDGFEATLVSFLGALFEDIFIDGRLNRSISSVEQALEVGEKLLAQTRQKRESLHTKLERTERIRSQLFGRLGGDRRGRVSAS